MSLVAIIDIGSSSVGGALLDTKHHKKGLICSQILFSVRNEISFSEKLDIPRFIKVVEKTIEKTAADLVASKYGHPGEIICFLSAPFYAAQIRTATVVYPKPLAITPKLISGLVKSELTKFEESQPHRAHEVIEGKLLQIKLNGYPTTQPYNNRAERIDLSVYCSIGTERHISRFRQIITGVFHQSRITFHTFSLALFSALHDLSPISNMLLVDIGGEITELTLIWRGVLWESGSFPMGRNFLIREIAKDLSTTPEEAASSLRLHLSGSNTKTASHKLEGSLSKQGDSWRSEFKSTLQSMLINCFLPENISLIGDPSLSPIFQKWLAANHFEGLSIGHQNFRIETLSAGAFAPFCNPESNATNDISIMVEAMFCDKLNSAK